MSHLDFLSKARLTVSADRRMQHIEQPTITFEEECAHIMKSRKLARVLDRQIVSAGRQSPYAASDASGSIVGALAGTLDESCAGGLCLPISSVLICLTTEACEQQV